MVLHHPRKFAPFLSYRPIKNYIYHDIAKGECSIMINKDIKHVNVGNEIEVCTKRKIKTFDRFFKCNYFTY